MLRLLIQDVTLLRQEEIEINVRWKGGARANCVCRCRSTRSSPGVPTRSVLKSIAAWAGTQTDEEIAARLNAEGRRTGSGLPFTYETVQRLRNERGIAGLREHLRRAGLRTTEEITRETGIAESTLRQWRKAGYLRAVHKHWLYEVPTAMVLTRIAEARRQK